MLTTTVKPKEPGPKAAKETTTKRGTSLSPNFKLVFFTVTGLTFFSIVVYILLSIIFPNSDPTSRLQDVIETLKSAFTLGFGAIVGLMGGKAL